MRYLERYENFNFEKLLCESVLVYSDDFLDKLNKFGEYYPNISELLLSLNNTNFPSSDISNVEIDPNNSEILKFSTEKKGSKKTQDIKIGRMLKRLMDLKGKNSVKISSEEMEKSINMLKAIIGYNESKFKEVSGPDIYSYYSMIDYDKNTGKARLRFNMPCAANWESLV